MLSTEYNSSQIFANGIALTPSELFRSFANKIHTAMRIVNIQNRQGMRRRKNFGQQKNPENTLLLMEYLKILGYFTFCL